MDRDTKICIWYEAGNPSGLRWGKEPAYCWSCPCGSRMRGRNSFNRFCDIQKSTVPYVHPYTRCLNVVALHLWRYHRGDGND